MTRDILTSVTRIADLEERDYAVEPLPREEWGTGDYVQVSVRGRPEPGCTVEDRQGRSLEPVEGSTIVGALGERRATRELVGSYEAVEDEEMDLITRGGVLGKVTSESPFAPSYVEASYEGHVHLEGQPARMQDYAVEASLQELSTPVVLVIGTTMSAGKTVSARVASRVLVDRGYDVVGCKLTGAGRMRDALTMATAGAEPVYDFVDAGLPSTIVPEKTFRNRIAGLLGRIEEHEADVLVAEVGASPLEPYNGAAAVDLVEDALAYTILCASDPYGVVGIEDAYRLKPDLVAGKVTNTSAGIDLLDELTGYDALNLHREAAKRPLAKRLETALDVA